MLKQYPGRVVAAIIVVVFFIAILHNNSEQQSFIPSNLLPQRQPNRAPPTLKERIALSEKAWKKSVDLRHEMAIKHPDNPQIPLFPAQTLNEFGKYPYTVWDFFPPTFSCPHDIQRVGRLGDGGKWVCGMSLYESVPRPSTWGAKPPTGGQEGVVIYSFGINAESSFEEEMLERIPSARIWGYDFSVNGWGPQIKSKYEDRVFFGKVGLGKTDEPSKSPPFYTLQSLMQQNNHTYMDILKIDVEGAEYDAFNSVMDYVQKSWSAGGEAVLPIGQVMIEIHTEDNTGVTFGVFRKWWERLEQMGMRPTWLEVNLLAVTIAHQKSNPRCVEYVWVNARDQQNILWLE